VAGAKRPAAAALPKGEQQAREVVKKKMRNFLFGKK
jgi:hypothetical protein